MADPTPEAAAETLSRQGLSGPAFDAAQIAGLLAGWDRAGRDLDELLARHQAEAAPADPTCFSPKW